MAHVDRLRGLLLWVMVAAVPGALAGDPAVPAAGAPERARPHVILVSMDTTRADALSCYGALPALGARGVVTPTLDAFAEAGARFERFYAQSPTTLSSHATMLTGRDPHAHAIPRNGFPLLPGTPTLTRRLAEAGYDTVAVVGAAPLEASMGLDDGFRVYDDRFSVQRGPQFQDPADGVVRRALAAVDARDTARPLFLFVHFFDPHQPYTPPARFADALVDPAYTGEARPVGLGSLRTRLARGRADPAELRHVAALYQAEVAFVDEQIGVLLAALGSRGLLDHAVVVITADHGEVLDEVPAFAYTHGSDVTDGSTRVPLLVRGYGVPLATRAVVRRQAEMAGLAPTIEVLAGLSPTLGAPFADAIRPGPVRDDDGWPRPTRPVFQEATRPFPTAGSQWNNLGLRRAVRAGGFEATAWPDGGQGVRITPPGDEAMAPVLQGMLRRWDAAAPPWRAEAMSVGTTDALRALGYLEDDPVDH